jgi:hypothetical protein
MDPRVQLENRTAMATSTGQSRRQEREAGSSLVAEEAEVEEEVAVVVE